jgi:hypothetical protein
MFAKKTLFVSILGLVCGGFFPYSAEVQSEEPSRISFAPLTEDEIDRFRDSLKNNVPLQSVSPKSSQRVDVVTEEVWLGSRTSAVTEINEVTLRFRPKTDELLARSVTSENSREALLGYVDMRFKIDYPKLIFSHSHPAHATEANGFRALLDRQSTATRVKMIQGQRESGMYVALPPFRDVGELWGAYVCPRSVRYQTRGAKRGLYLEKSPYGLSEVMIKPNGSCRATLEGGRGKARAAVTLQVSSELPESLSSHDQSIASVAEPRVDYQPKSPSDFFRFAPHTSVQQGINFLVEFQDRIGHIRRQNFSHVVSVYKSEEPSPVMALLGDQRAVEDSGECYFVQVQRYSWKEFDKSPAGF